MSAFSDQLSILIHRVLETGFGDLLTDLASGACFELSENREEDLSLNNAPLKKIIDQAKKEEKERGITPLCIAKGTIEWTYKSRLVKSPLLLQPCKATVDKVRKQICLESSDDDCFVNPVLIRNLKSEFDLDFTAEPETILQQLAEAGFQRIDKNVQFLGNFHHHRFDVLRDLESLQQHQPSDSLNQLFGEEKSEVAQFSFSEKNLEPSDPDQQSALKSVKETNTVIQGPPGTGKSQVLTNLIGKILCAGESALIVSEKRAALDVLVKKLRAHGLDHLATTVYDSGKTNDFLKDLKAQWLAFESANTFSISAVNSPIYLNNLQSILDLLNAPGIIGGVTYEEFILLSKGISFDQAAFDPEVPTISEWLKMKPVIQEIYKQGLGKTVNQLTYGVLQSDQLKKLDYSLFELKSTLETLQRIHSISTWSELFFLMKKAATAHYFTSDVYHRYAPLLKKDSVQQKKFLKLRTTYLQLKNELEFVQNTAQWIRKPGEAEVDQLLQDLSQNSWFKQRKLVKQWRQFSNLDVSHAPKMLESRTKEIALLKKQVDCTNSLLDLGIERPEEQLDLVYYQIGQFPHELAEDLQKLSADKLRELAGINKQLHDFQTHLRLLFRFDDDANLTSLLDDTKINISGILSVFGSKPYFSEQALKALIKYKTPAAFECAVLQSSYQAFVNQFPIIRNFEPSELLLKSHQIIEAQKEESEILAKEILNTQYERFDQAVRLLQMPINKLSIDQKERRAKLKKGKAILVRAFSKQRNLPSYYELMQSEAVEWVRILKPIWMCNPVQVARIFPLEPELFDMGIFDEASQIPLENGLGAIYRSKRITVAGDSQQMSPSTYFKAGSKDAVDLLHQASFHWKNVSLKHHYRSDHPELIRFSNRYFYQNELKAFPSFTALKQPIQSHLVEGRYENGKNLIEANATAAFIQKTLSSEETIGIVAFSQSQLEAIFTALDPKSQEILLERIEEDRAFLRSLEHVQGDECDHLIISLGYGKDEDGQFHMRFGPLNQAGGGKRLNVLLTRARKKIDFFHSVTASDFSLSQNENVDLLRRFLHQLETAKTETKIEFPGSLEPIQHGNKLTFSHIFSSIPDAGELVTLVRVLESRGWKLAFN